jgi:uncharacterized protein Yka (UPF0111/DUF47 family)
VLTAGIQSRVPRFQLLPAEVRFYDWFEKSAANMVEAARILIGLVGALENRDEVNRRVQQLTEAEHRGDFIVHEIFDLLHSTFITPLDRDQIAEIARSLDDVVDRIEAAGDVFLLYKIDHATPEATRLAQIVLACAEQIDQAMPMLREKNRLPGVRDRMIEVNRLENEADAVLRVGLAALVERPDQLFDLIRWKEVYSLLEEATDRAEDVADVLNGIVLENA